MKANIKSSEILCLKALEAKARKAALAAAKAKATAANTQSGTAAPRAAKKGAKEQTIESEIRSIFNMMRTAAANNRGVKMEKLACTATCKGLIGVYSKRADSDGREMLADAPSELYGFYADTRDSAKLGSVAIYCDDVAAYMSRISRQGAIFGHRIASATVVMGRRRFIDVTFAG